jgi:Spy/CpxP family protein refolding chaperone
MMSKSNTILAALFVLATVFWVAPEVKAGHFGHKPPMHDMKPPIPGMEDSPFGLKFILELKLSDSQQAELTKIINKYQNEEKHLKKKVMEARKNLMSVMHAEPLNEAAARKAFRNASILEEDGFILRAKMMGELNSVLTPRQKDVLKKRREQKIKRVGQHFDTRHKNDGE